MDEQKTKTIWIVFGTCGEYSDRREWMVKAFTSQDAAIVFRNTCQRVSNRLKRRLDRWDLGFEFEYNNRNHKIRRKWMIDPDWRSDYTGTDYYEAKVELVL